MAKLSFYLRLAWSNLRRGSDISLPYLLAVTVVAAVYLLISGLLFSDGLANITSGQTTQAIFAFGLSVFSVFAFCFLLYLNNFLIRRRQREFALYAVLGLTRGQVNLVLLAENLLLLGGGLLLGVFLALAVGPLVFSLLLRLIQVAAGSVFRLAPLAYLITLGLFVLVFVASAVSNFFRIRVSNPIELLQTSRAGERRSPLLIPMAILGFVLLGIAYYLAWILDDASLALGLFFLLVLLVIIATYLLFIAGSNVVLRLLRASKRLYYRMPGFITISGLLHRLRQNATGLASITILSTMLVVTVSGTLALYLGTESMVAPRYPYDMTIYLYEDPALVAEYDSELTRMAAEHQVRIYDDPASLAALLAGEQGEWISDETGIDQRGDRVYIDGGQCYFNLEGRLEDCLAFAEAARQLHAQVFDHQPYGYVDDVFSVRLDSYALYGGLLFLGAFFGLLFLAITVLIIYFKQLAEGFEDRERFRLLQQVGMEEKQVREVIRRQLLWVFFLPLAATLLHMLFASRIISVMLQVFHLHDWQLVVSCVAATCLLFALLYLVMYLLTARVYYRIVRLGEG